MKIYRIIARKAGAPYVLAEEISTYRKIEGETAKHYLCNDPVIYTDLKGGCYSAPLADIVTIQDATNIIYSMGVYKIPVDLIA